uniref:NIF system FeS cluster assembly NifU N-terminal domain-containing protein n=1 Tax=viral metagenome TaxID=1070528 RepID=A0A6C0ENF2_9ZZZZ
MLKVYGILINKSMRRFYHGNVIEHYERPRNVGSLDKKSSRVGSGLVGAPACIHEDTMIAVADGRRSVSVKILYSENKIIEVWSYNHKKDIYEIKNARVIKNNFKKPMKKVILDDNSFIICTYDHKLLLKNNTYLEVKNINNNVSLVPFKRMTTKKGQVELCNNYNHKIKKIENLEGEFDCYDLQVEENNNFAVITKETKNIDNGIIIKNCGDVMKLDIEVDEQGIIIQSKFKTFGCGSAMASSSVTTEWVKGKHIDDAIQITNKDIASFLKLPPVKLHCSMLAEDAIKAAVKDYKEKQ